MPINYSISIFYKKENINKILQSYMKILDKENMKELKNCLPWEPEKVEVYYKNNLEKKLSFGIKNFKVNIDSINHYCCSIKIPKGIKVDRSYIKNNNTIGCFYTSILCDEKYSCLEISSPATYFSLEIFDKQTFKALILNTFKDYSDVILFDKETEEMYILYPLQKTIKIPDEDDFYIDIIHYDLSYIMQYILNELKKMTPNTR